MSFRRAAFKADGPFQVRRPFDLDGVTLKIGEKFESDKVSARRLRQLYEGRYINQDDTPQVQKAQLPDGWKTLRAAELKQLAEMVTGVKAASRQEAFAALQAYGTS